MRKATASRERQSGVTLLELLIALLIIGILASVALSSYSSQTIKSRRTDARSAILDLASREEKIFSANNAYSMLPSDLGYGPVGTPFPVLVGSGYYNIAVTVPDPNQAAVTPTTYIITATPVAGSTQANDSACTTLTLNQLGVQGSTGTGTAATCWNN